VAPHEEIRLETLDGTVIAYFAPNAEVTRSFDNDVTQEGLPGGDEASLVLDFGQWTTEVTVQGFFESSEGLPQAHADDLETLFGKSPVTAQDQFNRLVGFTAYGQTGPYALYNEGNEYTATGQAGVDVQAGTYPAVAVSQIQPSRVSGETREAYTVRFNAGVEGGGEE